MNAPRRTGPNRWLPARCWLATSLLIAFCAADRSRGEAMLQLFNVSWSELTRKMPEIAEAGYTSLWLPPPAKAGSVFSVGYDQFDPFDLGDKNQRGTTATRWGTKVQLLQMVETAHRFGIRVYFDNVMNHRGFEVPGYNASTPTNLYPGLRPQDFHLRVLSGGTYVNWPNVEDWGNSWNVQYEPLSGLVDLANEPGGVNGNFGYSLGSTTPKIAFIRHPANPEFYMDPAGPQLGGVWRPFNGSNGVPVAEEVNAYLIRAAMWTLYSTRCDGFRLDAVKHTPSGFFGDAAAPFAGYTGGIQAIFDWIHGYGTNFNGDYYEPDDCRNSCFDTEAPRNDAMLFGEHAGAPPAYGEYITAGMRLLNVPLRGALEAAMSGGSLSGMDQRDIGSFGANQGVQFAQDHDQMFCCVSRRELHNAYNLLHEGLPLVYSDGYNQAGPPSDPATFPIAPLANYLGEFGDNQLPDLCYLHLQLARGGTRPRWSDQNIVAWERYDHRDIPSGDAFTNADATVVFFALNNNYTYPGDILFDDGISRTPDGYYTCANGSPSRGYAMRIGFPPGSVLSQLASSAPGAARACPRLLVHRATTDRNQALASANAAAPADRMLLVNTTPPPGGGAVELLIPSGGWVLYGYQWPEPSRANPFTNAITFFQGGAPAPTVVIHRQDGTNGDPAFSPLYPFKMRGSVDPDGAVKLAPGEGNVSNLTYAIRIPVLTNGPVDIAIRCDASAANVLAKLDGGIDLNSQMGLGVTTGLDRRDNRPGTASDVFLGYEQAILQTRTGPEKFAAALVSRNNVTSAGAETYSYTVGGTDQTLDGSGNGAGITTQTASWVYHAPAATNTAAPPNSSSTQRRPLNPAPDQAVEVFFKVGYNFRTNHACLYFTTDGTDPQGAFGIGQGSTRTAPAAWLGRDSTDAAIDWFKATIPSDCHVPGTQVRYKAAVWQDNIAPLSDADNAKRFGAAQFGITNLDPANVTVWLHNNRNTNLTATGLTSGFHILRARAFLPRNGKSGVFNTFLQTFYYDDQLPRGAIAYPPADGGTIGSSSYVVVVRADSAATAVEYTIQDVNGSTSGSATPVTPDAAITQQFPDFPQEFRFPYNGVPSLGQAVITVRLKGLASSAYPNRVATLTRTINTLGPVQVVQIANPATNGALAILGSNEIYTVRACFTASLTTTNYQLFSLYMNGVFQPRQAPNGAPLYLIDSTGCGSGLRRFSFNWAQAPSGSNTVQVVFTNGFTLSDTRVFALARPGDPADSDADSMPNWMEILAGTDPYNRDSVLRITRIVPGPQTGIGWPGVSNKYYQVLATTNLNSPLVPVSDILPGTSTNLWWLDSAPDPANKLYRIQLKW